MSKYSTFYSNPVQLVRYDGHAANAFIPVGSHVVQTNAAAWTLDAVPPIEAVAMFLSLIGNVKYTLDGVTVPDAVGNVGLNFANNIVFIKPGTTVKFSGAAASVLNMQWLGSV